MGKDEVLDFVKSCGETDTLEEIIALSIERKGKLVALHPEEGDIIELVFPEDHAFTKLTGKEAKITKIQGGTYTCDVEDMPMEIALDMIAKVVRGNKNE